jgi:hypothetical protein
LLSSKIADENLREVVSRTDELMMVTGCPLALLTIPQIYAGFCSQNEESNAV